MSATSSDQDPIETLDSIERRRRALSIREAASAVGSDVRSIRRRLAAGAFPGAYKDVDAERPGVLIWHIPFDDLVAAGFVPNELSQSNYDEITEGLLSTSPATVASLIATDRFARLRSELAEAVAAAELALLRAQADRWRAVAEERGRALDRADLALQTLSIAIQGQATATPAVAPGPTAAPADAPNTAPAGAPQPAGPPTDNMVPPHVRSEAVLYAESLVRRKTRKRRWRRRS